MASSEDRGFIVPFAGGEVPEGDNIVQLRDGQMVVCDFGEQQHLISKEGQQLLDDLASKGTDLEQPQLRGVDDLIERLRKGRLLKDEDIIRELCNSSITGPVTGKKFAEGLVSKQFGIQKQMRVAKHELHHVERVLVTSEEWLTRVNARENFGNADPEESKLTVQIVAVQNFQREIQEGTAFKVQLECQSQAIETKLQGCRLGNVLWNEMFSFQVEPHEGDLHITLVKTDFQYTPCGEVSLVLDDLADQRKHELCREVWGATNCEMVIAAQWIYSKKILFTSFTREYTAKREATVRKMNQLQYDLERLSSSITRSDRRSAGAGMDLGSLLQGPEFIAQSIDRALVNMKLSNYQVASQYVVGISLLLCCIASYARPLFLDLQIMGFAFWCNLDFRRWSLTRYTVVLAGMIFSELLDLVWIATFFSLWTNSTVEADMQNITKVFSIFNCIWKVLIIFFFWKCHYDLKKKSTRTVPTRARLTPANRADAAPPVAATP